MIFNRRGLAGYIPHGERGVTGPEDIVRPIYITEVISAHVDSRAPKALESRAVCIKVRSVNIRPAAMIRRGLWMFSEHGSCRKKMSKDHWNPPTNLHHGPLIHRSEDAYSQANPFFHTLESLTTPVKPNRDSTAHIWDGHGALGGA